MIYKSLQYQQMDGSAIRLLIRSEINSLELCICWYSNDL